MTHPKYALFASDRGLDTGHAYIYPTPMVDTVLRVFQYVPPLIAVTEDDWQKFCGGTIPLQAELPARRIHILAVTLLAPPDRHQPGRQRRKRLPEHRTVSCRCGRQRLSRAQGRHACPPGRGRVFSDRSATATSLALPPSGLHLVAARARLVTGAGTFSRKHCASGTRFPIHLKPSSTSLGHYRVFRQRT